MNTVHPETLEEQVRRLTQEREEAYKQVVDLYGTLQEVSHAIPSRHSWRALLLPDHLYDAQDEAFKRMRQFDNHPAFH